MGNLEKIAKNYIIPSRSKFQIQKFVIEKHDTPEMQYQQILIEGADLTYKIKMAELNIKKTMIEIKKLKKTGDEIDLITAQEKELGINYTKLVLESARYEYAALEDLFNKYPSYSYSDIEANQPEYWQKRLMRQADQDIMQAQKGINAGNLESMIALNMVSFISEDKQKELE